MRELCHVVFPRCEPSAAPMWYAKARNTKHKQCRRLGLALPVPRQVRKGRRRREVLARCAMVEGAGGARRAAEAVRRILCVMVLGRSDLLPGSSMRFANLSRSPALTLRMANRMSSEANLLQVRLQHWRERSLQAWECRCCQGCLLPCASWRRLG